MFFPIKDYNPTRRTAYVTILIISVNIAVFLYQGVISDLNYQVHKHAMIPWEIAHMKNIPAPIGYTIDEQYGHPRRKLVYRSTHPAVTLLTSMFMHGSFLHLLGNMLFLWIFGNNIEDTLGRWRFILFYVLSGVGAALVHVLFNLNSQVPVIGASGAVSGVMGAYLVLFPAARVRTLVFILFFITFVDVPAFVFLFVWFLLQFLYVGGQGIAWLAHVGGFLIGMGLIKWWRPRRAAAVEILDEDSDPYMH